MKTTIVGIITLALVGLVALVWVALTNPNGAGLKPTAQPTAPPTVPLTPEQVAAEARQRKVMEERARKQHAEYLKSPVGRVSSKHPGWSIDVCTIVAAHKVRIGMTAEQALASWGRPESINDTTTPNGTMSQWVYNDHSAYLYVANGVVVASQTSR